MAGREAWSTAQGAVIVVGLAAAGVASYMAHRSSGDTQDGLIAAAAGLLGGSVAALAGWMQTRADREDRRDVSLLAARTEAYAEVLEAATLYNSQRTAAREFYARHLAATEQGLDGPAADFDHRSATAFHEALALVARLNSGIAKARLYAEGAMRAALDTLGAELESRRDLAPSASAEQAELPLNAFQDAMEAETGKTAR